jgi:DNA-binding response OmpR family regulator
MDMRMPVMDGYEATRQIKSQLKGQATAIVALTASALEEEREVVLPAGCDDFVRKPFREEVLFEKMAAYLGAQYLYANPINSDPELAFPVELSPALIGEMLATQPQSWLETLEIAATQADGEQVLQLLELVDHAQLRQAIDSLAIENLGLTATQVLLTDG